MTLRQSHRRWLATGLVTSAALLTGCESIPRNSVTEALNLTSAPATLELPPPPPKDRQWTNAEDDVIYSRVTGFGLARLPAMESYLNALLQQIRQEAGVPDWPGKVYVQADPGLNAYTRGAGNIYLSIGFLSAATTEDEVFGLLAHEFAHSYLQYAALEQTVVDSDKFSNVSAAITYVGRGIAQTGGQGKLSQSQQLQALRPARNFLLAYQLGRNTLAPAWERSQEHAADALAVRLSIRMGYSVPDGLVAMLERLHASEQEEDRRKAELRDRVRKDFDATREQAQKQMGNDPKALDNFVNSFQNELLTNFSQIGGDFTGYLTSTHPSTDKRIDRVNQLHEQLMKSREWPAARTEAWLKVKNQAGVQRAFAGYRSAAEAQLALSTDSHDDARRFARASYTDETHGHALPAMMLWQSGYTDKNNTMSKAMLANMNSPQHRSWRPYLVYAQHLHQSGKKKQAQTVLDEGFSHFARAPLAWVEYIDMQLQFNDGAKAQALAQQCAEKFPSFGPACQRAATPNKAEKVAPGKVKVDLGWMDRLLQR